MSRLFACDSCKEHRAVTASITVTQDEARLRFCGWPCVMAFASRLCVPPTRFCHATSDDRFICSLDEGHLGPHTAEGDERGVALASWEAGF